MRSILSSVSGVEILPVQWSLLPVRSRGCVPTWVGCGGAGRTPPTRGSGELRLDVRGVDAGERRLELREAIGDVRLLGEDVGVGDADLAVTTQQEHSRIVLRPRVSELVDRDPGLRHLGVHRAHVARLPYG